MAYAQGLPKGSQAEPKSTREPGCTHCKQRLKSIDVLREHLPADWSLQLEREPVFNGEVLTVQAGLANAQTVLLVHGLGQNGFTDWLHVMPQLAQRHHVIALDLPGFGYSASPWGKYSPTNYARVLQWLLTRYGKGRAVVVGHSMGGAISLRFASDFPELVDKLILADAAGILYRTAFVKHTASLPLSVEQTPGILKEHVARAMDFSNATVEKVLGLAADPTRWVRWNDLAWAVALRDQSRTNAALALVDENFSTAVYTLQRPTHLIWGEADGVAPLRTGQMLVKRLPRAELHTLPGVGHVPMVTASEAFLAVLNNALQTEPAADTPVEHGQPATADLACSGLVDRQFAGRYREVRIEGCAAIRLADIDAERIIIRDSIVHLLNVRIRGDGVALDVSNSQLIATASDVSGAIAIRADNSRLDLAGVTLAATGSAVEVNRWSRLIASISEIRSPAYTGYWHGSYELEAAALVPHR